MRRPRLCPRHDLPLFQDLGEAEPVCQGCLRARLPDPGPTAEELEAEARQEAEIAEEARREMRELRRLSVPKEFRPDPDIEE